MLFARDLFERATTGIGLKAAVAPTATAVSVLNDYRMADLACSTSTRPEFIVENQSAANTRAAEDAEQVGSASAST